MESTGRVALVTGGAVRVGREIALALADQGFDVAVHYRTSEAPAKATVADITAREVGAASFQADLSNVTEIASLIADIEEWRGRLDVLVNSAAVFPRTPWSEIDEATWDATMTTNLKAPFFTAWHASRLIRASGGGKIINIADWAGLRPYRHYAPYVIAKGGVVTMTKAMAKELAPDIAVNAIAPGPVMLPEDFSEDDAASIIDQTLVKRLGTPHDIAQSVVYLTTMTDFVTGHVLVVDGGRLIGA